MYPAENGDAFLVSSNGTNVLIDGGYAKTFNTHIRSDLNKLAKKGECLDLVIATHIDSDHIGGLIKFFSLNGSSEKPNIIGVKNIWHNSLRSLTLPCESEIPFEALEVIEAINRRGHPKESRQETAAVEEISARQGSTLASLIHAGKYTWNDCDGTKSISVNNNWESVVPYGRIRVLTPSKIRLEGLLKSWKKDLRCYGYTGSLGAGLLIDDAFEFNLEHRNETQVREQKLISAGQRKKLEDIYSPDDSPTNGSSVATVIELDGIQMLMLADAWAEDVLEAVLQLKSEGCSMMFDAIKISHHGSFHNTSPELLSIVDAPVYFISSNGSKHGHPDIEILRAIVDRKASFVRTLYFNYSTLESKEIRSYQTTAGASFLIYENATGWIEIIKRESC